MKRSEFIAGFIHARKVGYRAQFANGELRPSEAAMGLVDAEADALKSWRKLDAQVRAMPARELFRGTCDRPDPGNPGEWTAKREAPTPAPGPWCAVNQTGNHPQGWYVKHGENPFGWPIGTEADARLVAAAPDLLGALNACLNAAPSLAYSAAGDRARAAIAKAGPGHTAAAGADVQSVAVKLLTDNDGLRFALDSAAGVLRVALAYHAEEFDGPPDQDLNVSGADLVDFFSSWRETARTSLATARRLIREEK